MKSFNILFFCFISSATNLLGQNFNKSINKDSLFQIVIKKLPEERRNEALKMYNEGNDEAREFLLFMLSMPTSSKKELIANIDSNFEKIIYLKTEYSKLVPENHIIYIEFNSANEIAMTKETIDLGIGYINESKKDYRKEWNLEYNSNKLREMLKSINWTDETIKSIRKLLTDANCVSIENGEISTIGFSRSGFGKYSFKLFSNDLTNEQIQQYNDGCSYIFYKKNIVLEYGGGAVGPQCFPDRQD